MEKKILGANDQIAARLRDAFSTAGTLVVNLISHRVRARPCCSKRRYECYRPGHGPRFLPATSRPTTMLAVGSYGYPVRQITTAGACHLDAEWWRITSPAGSTIVSRWTCC